MVRLTGDLPLARKSGKRMAFTTALWKIDQNKPITVSAAHVGLEKHLEDWIEADSSIVGLDLMFIGRQVATDYGGFIDLLALDENANPVILELKRDKTPREVVAQVLDYASWVKGLTEADLDRIHRNYKNKRLSDAFSDHFPAQLPNAVNSSHSMIIVASHLDDSSERIVQYLQSEYSININAIFFNFFAVDNGTNLLARSWLTDPEIVENRSETRKQAPRSEYWFVNVGEPDRDWEDCLKYNFVSAGGGTKWSGRLSKLSIGSKIFAFLTNGKQRGYVGYGTVTDTAVMVKDFVVDDQGGTLATMPMKQTLKNTDDADLSDYAVKIKWHKTFDRTDAQWQKNGFANQNNVCRMPVGDTVSFLEKQFGVDLY